MPNCPEYLSTPPVTVRKSRSKKLEERENKELADAPRNSQEEFQQQQKYNKIYNLQDIKQKIKLKDFWKLFHYNDSLSICTF